jgi:hypothetical protein
VPTATRTALKKVKRVKLVLTIGTTKRATGTAG